ncbi:hypothetical protein Dimus_020013 [Dionaea muscipula]
MSTLSIITPLLLLLLLLILLSAQSSNAAEATAATARVKDYSYTRLPLVGTGAYGPESTAFDCNGEGPYAGVSDGRIFKWLSSNGSWVEFATTSPYRTRKLCDGVMDTKMERVCGRPLGLKFNLGTCDLYITDAYFGLVVVGSKGGLARQLVNNAEGVPFKFANSLDIDSDIGVVYFTDSSTRFQRWEMLEIIGTFDKTGRLLKYDIGNQKVTVLMRNLAYANGVALSRKKDYVLVTETTTGRVYRYWLHDHDSHGGSHDAAELFLQLGGMLDNINRNADGDYWIAQYPIPSLITAAATTLGTTDQGAPVRVNQSGIVVEILNNTDGLSVSDVNEFNSKLWLGTVVSPYLAMASCHT